MNSSSLVFFVLFTICVPCDSELQRISVLGVVDGQKVTYHPEQSYEIKYDEGHTIKLTCVDLSNKAYWKQKKDGLTLFSQNYQDAKSRVQIEMKLYKFDSDSKLSCVGVGDGTTVSISLKLRGNSIQKDRISENETKSVYIGEKVNAQTLCKRSDSANIHSYAVLSDNSIITTEETYEFNVNKDHDGIVFFCTSLESQDTQATETKIKRVVDFQNDNYSPKPIEFVEGQVLNYTCQRKVQYGDNLIVQWIQQKRDTKLFIGSKNHMKTSISMKLYRFDDNSTLSCIAYVESSNEEKYRITIPLYLNKNSLPLKAAATPQTKRFKIGEKLSMTCEYNSTDKQKHIYSVSPDNSIVTTTNSYVSEQSDGFQYFCIVNVSSGLMDERVIENHIKIFIKDPAFSYRIIILIAIALGAIMILGILIFVICKFVKQKQTQGTLKSQTVNESRDVLTKNVVEQPEPVYAAPEQVIYAELQLHDNARNRDSNQEEGHYAQIIGVMAARK